MNDTERYNKRRRENLITTTVDDYPVIKFGTGNIFLDLEDKLSLDWTSQISINNLGFQNSYVKDFIEQQIREVSGNIGSDWQFFSSINFQGQKIEISQAALAEEIKTIIPWPGSWKIMFDATGGLGVINSFRLAKATYLMNKYGWTVLKKKLEEHLRKDIFEPSRSDLFKFGILVLRNGFHGRPGDAQALTNSKPEQLFAASSSCVIGRLPFPFHGLTRKALLGEAQKIISRLIKKAPLVEFIFEPIQGEGGINIPDLELLADLVLLAKEHGALICIDEVQTFCRTGKWFALEHFPDIKPDLIVLSKSLGGGLPISATIANMDVISDLPRGCHSGTFQAAPIPTAAAIAVLKYIKEWNLIENTKVAGEYLLKILRDIHLYFDDIIKEVRGLGLMIGVEFFKTVIRNEIVEKCRLAEPKGLLLAPAGTNAIRFIPPLIIDENEIERGLDIFRRVLQEVT